MQESAKLFYAGASPVRNSISGQWHSWLAQTLDKRQVVGSSPTCPTIFAGLTQMVECLLYTQNVGGSIPSSRTILAR
jgi:hypothetical protein